MTGLEVSVYIAADQITRAVQSGNPEEARRIVDQHVDILDYVVAVLADRCPPLPVTDVYASRMQRVQAVRDMQAAGVPPKVIAARMSRHHVAQAGAA